MYILYFKVFGSQAYILILKEDRANKLTAQAKEAIFIGYEKGTKGYKFWSSKRQKVVISSTATFDKFTFPFCAKKTDDKPPSLSIPNDSNDTQESDKSDKPKSLEDVPTTYYYQFPPQKDELPNPQIPPKQGPDDQQPSRPTTSDSNTNSPPPIIHHQFLPLLMMQRNLDMELEFTIPTFFLTTYMEIELQ